MIDLTQESLIPIREVPRHLPPRSSGKRLHISGVYRWMLHGVRGHRLEAIKVGGTTYTSKEALQRFADQLSQGRLAPAPPPPAPSSRQRQIERADREARRILGPTTRDGRGGSPDHR